MGFSRINTGLWAWALWIGTGFWTPVVAQQSAAPIIRAVEFRGLAQMKESLARDLTRVKIGDPFSSAEVDQAIARLLRTGRFLTVMYESTPVPDGVRLTFVLRERAVISAIRFQGNRKFKDAKLAKELTQQEGDIVDWLAVRDARESIQAMYREAGYTDASVSYDRKQIEATGEVVFTIQEGRHVRIREIRFEGNQSFTDRQLSKNVETKKAFWIIRSGAFDEMRAEADVASLRKFYRDEGFLDAQVRVRTELDETGVRMVVVFIVDEGARYQVEAVEFRGHSVFSNDALLGFMATRVDGTIKRRQLDKDVRAIQTRYGEIGHIYATVRAVRVFSNAPGFVRITIEIKEGEAFRTGRVIVRGNTRTRDKVVRRALNLYPPDDLFDLTEAREAERRLSESKIFSSARVYPVGDQPGVRDVVMDVKEAEKAGDFSFGAGVTSNSGLIGNIVLDLQNFDLQDRPKSFKELIKLRSFFGGGQRLRIELQPGTTTSRFRVDFTEPYFRDKPTRFDFSAFLFQRGRDGYDEQRVGTSVSLGRRFERGRWRGWTGELAFRVENVDVDDVELFSSGEIRDDEGGNLITSLRGTMIRDRTDNRFVPTTGGRLRLSYEQVGAFGGDHFFGKLTGGYRWYKTMRTDRLDRKHVLQLRAEGGVIIGDAPVFSRFFAGGTGSIRGFDFRGVGERDGIDDNNIGGDFLILLGAEYAFPLMGENLRGHLFLDTGTAGSGGLRAALGIGARFTLNLFGPLPLEFNLAAPFSTQSGDDTQVFSFLIGRSF